MDKTILNLEREKVNMQNYISNINKLTSMVEQVNGVYLDYLECKKAIVLATVTSVLTVLLSAMRLPFLNDLLKGYSQWIIMLVGGIMTFVFLFIQAKTKIVQNVLYFSAVIMIMVAVCFGYMYNPIPFAGLFLLWVYVVIRLYNHKVSVWKIVNGTEGQ